MSQIHQVLQTPAHSVVQKGINPTAARSEGKTWLHLPALLFMIVLTQIPFLLAVWFSLHAWNLLVPSEGFPFVGLTNYVNEFVHDPNFWPILGNTLQLVAALSSWRLWEEPSWHCCSTGQSGAEPSYEHWPPFPFSSRHR
jgi:hypothetical protein